MIPKTEISDIMTTPFTTTGPVESTVMQVTLMESMKNYFQYRCVCSCGIPEITLEGTVEDYQSIIDRLQKLKHVFPDLKKSFEKMEGHMIKVMDSASGEEDTDFWNTIMTKIRIGSGGETELSGWLMDFFPSGVQLEIAPPGVTFTPFKLDDNGALFNMRLVAGFMGVARDEKKPGAVRPAIGWMTYYEE